MKITLKDTQPHLIETPCLVIGGRPMHENKEIISLLVSGATDIPG